jgi:16S rRNA (cytosine1402-N4)-methyltransferase
MSGTSYHDPVLLKESVDALDIRADGIYVDATLGGGGHTREILRRLGANGKLFVFDRDDAAGANLPDDERVVWVRHNYRYAWRFLRYYEALPVNGLLADLGVSSHQFDSGERGFSIRFNGPLDMRMAAAAGLTAAEVVNTYPEERLIRIFSEYGEIQNARQLVRRILTARSAGALTTTTALREVVLPVADRARESQYLARVFQALRIEVNDELASLRDLLEQTPALIAPEGRMVFITYHSLEDRLVKRFIADGRFDGEVEKDVFGNAPKTPFRALTRKPLEPTAEEIERNPRARSARLRVAIRNN